MVEVMLGGKSDVPLSRLAAQSLYRRMLSTGLRVLEYQPQVLHAKLIIIDDIIYVGSANLDQRSLNINYELLVRLQDPVESARARQIFEERRKHCHEVTRDHWKRSWSLWGRFKRRWAYFLLVRIDPLVARWQLRGLPD
jgi:cardiolipin synthase